MHWHLVLATDTFTHSASSFSSYTQPFGAACSTFSMKLYYKESLVSSSPVARRGTEVFRYRADPQCNIWLPLIRNQYRSSTPVVSHRHWHCQDVSSSYDWLTISIHMVIIRTFWVLFICSLLCLHQLNFYLSKHICLSLTLVPCSPEWYIGTMLSLPSATYVDFILKYWLWTRCKHETPGLWMINNYALPLSIRHAYARHRATPHAHKILPKLPSMLALLWGEPVFISYYTAVDRCIS